MSSFSVMAEIQSATCRTTASHDGASANRITYSQVNWFSTSTAVLTELFGTLHSKIDSKITTTAYHFIADGDYVVVEARGSNTTHAGIPYNNAFRFVFRLAGGKLTEVTE